LKVLTKASNKNIPNFSHTPNQKFCIPSTFKTNQNFQIWL